MEKLTLDLFTTSRFHQQVLVDTTPLPEDIPAVKEIGASSAPLLSASFFIGARCRDYNDDYMQCKTEKAGTGEVDCMKEGRRVTRCASSVYVLCHADIPSGAAMTVGRIRLYGYQIRSPKRHHQRSSTTSSYANIFIVSRISTLTA